MPPCLRPTRTLTYLLVPLSLYLAVLLACSADLPEPKSRGAQLYKTYCSDKACHAALPPKRGGKRYWDIQYNRMLEIMAQQGKKSPTPDETKEILAYLYRHTHSGAKKND